MRATTLKHETVTVSGSNQTLSYADADQTERVKEGLVTEAWSPLGLGEEDTSTYGTYYFLRDNQGNPLGETHGGVNYYFFTDGLGSITDVLDGNNGDTTRSYSYDPGATSAQPATATSPTSATPATGSETKPTSTLAAPPSTRSEPATTTRPSAVGHNRIPSAERSATPQPVTDTPTRAMILSTTLTRAACPSSEMSATSSRTPSPAQSRTTRSSP